MTQEQIQQYMSEADSALDLGQNQQAVDLYTKVLNEEPKNHIALMMLGSIYGDIGDIPKAVNFLNQSINANADYAEPHFILGHINHATNQIDAAISSFAKAIEIDSEDSEYQKALGGIYHQTSQYNLAIPCFEKTINLNKSDAESTFMLACLYHSTGNFVSAREFYQKTINLDPSNDEAVISLASLMLVNRSVLEADKLIRQVFEQRNFDDLITAKKATYFNLFSSISRGKGDLTEALDNINNALNLQSDSIEFLINKAAVLEAMQEYDESFDILQPILESEVVSVSAALLFARLSSVFDMKDDARNLIIHLLKDTELPAPDRSSLEDWLALGR